MYDNSGKSSRFSENFEANESATYIDRWLQFYKKLIHDSRHYAARSYSSRFILKHKTVLEMINLEIATTVLLLAVCGPATIN